MYKLVGTSVRISIWISLSFSSNKNSYHIKPRSLSFLHTFRSDLLIPQASSSLRAKLSGLRIKADEADRTLEIARQKGRKDHER